ncbi:MAG: nicotinate-nucleotide adenylyltransferase [Burkholderiaceae bacterium]
MKIASTPAARIGLFGGTFDPVHIAHLALARSALEQLALDELRWLPTAHSWQKPDPPAPAADREAMLRIAIAGEPCFVLDARELHRSGPGYTLDTVRELQAEQPGARWFLVIGQDQFEGLHTWHDWPELLARVTLAVAQRPGAAGIVHPQVRQAAQAHVLLPMMAVSSTDVRRRAAAGEPVDSLVPPGVARYIEDHRLYRRVTAVESGLTGS